MLKNFFKSTANIVVSVVVLVLVILVVVFGFKVNKWYKDSLALQLQTDKHLAKITQAIAALDEKYAAPLADLSAQIANNNQGINALTVDIKNIKLMSGAQLGDLTEDVTKTCEEKFAIVSGQFTLCLDKTTKQDAALILCGENEVKWKHAEQLWTERDKDTKIALGLCEGEYKKLLSTSIKAQRKADNKFVVYFGAGVSTGAVDLDGSFKMKLRPALQLGAGLKLFSF